MRRMCFSPLKSTRRALAAGVVLGVLLAGVAQVYDVTLGGNVREVIPGRLYRCAQPSADGLEALVRRHGIRTVVNLRGDNVGEPWYERERQTARRLGVAFVDVGLWAYHPPLADQLCLLVDTLRGAEYPVLVHCNSGGDRAGLASALGVLLQTAADVPAARGQLAWWLGHNPLGMAACHDRLLDRYDEWLRGRGAG